MANWIQACTESLPAEPKPERVHTAELDELYTFVGNKKTEFTFSPSLIGNSLPLELGCGYRSKPRNDAGLFGSGFGSQAILQ